MIGDLYQFSIPRLSAGRGLANATVEGRLAHLEHLQQS